MSKQSKRPADISLLARKIVEEATGQKFASKKNPAAVALGGLGGRARAARLSAEERTAIAKKAAIARWSSGGKT